MDTLTTDDILNIAEHIEKNGTSTGEFFAAKGLEIQSVIRAMSVLVSEGDGRRQSYQAGLLLGLQIGAMRLDPIEFVPPPKDDAEKQPCNCIMCQLMRAAEDEDEE